MTSDSLSPAKADALLIRDAYALIVAIPKWLGKNDPFGSWAWVFGCVIGALIIARLVQTPGIPAFQQDWMWPTSQQAILGWLHLATSAWVWQGLGNPQVYPFAQFLVGFEAHVALILGTKTTLDLALFASFTLGTVGAMRAIALCGVSRRLSILVAGLAYGASPVVYNKLAAGHTYYLVGLALLPWIVFWLWRGSRRLSVDVTALVALLLALSWSQAQFVVFDGFALIIFAALARTRAAFAIVGIALAIAISIHIFPIISLFHPSISSQLAYQQSNSAGVASESVGLVNLFKQSGYPPRYFRLISADTNAAVGFAPSAALLLGLLALAGFLISLRVSRFKRPETLGIAILGVIGAVIVLGFNPPFGVVMKWMFEHVTAMGVLKELYHAMVLVSLAVACGVAIVVDVSLGALASRDLAVAPVALTFAILASISALGTASPALEGLYTTQVGFRDGASLDSLIQTYTDGVRGPGRVFLVPSVAPIRAEERPIGGGLDTDSLRPWYWSSIFSGEADPQLAYLDTITAFGSATRLDYVMTRFGVAALVLRKHFHSTSAEQAGMPANTFDFTHIQNELGDSGLNFEQNDDDETVWTNNHFSGVVLAGNAPIRTTTDIVGSDQYVGSRGFARGAYAPTIFVDPFPPGSTFTIPINALAPEFNPRVGWSRTQFTFFMNRWQNNAPEGAIFTYVSAPLTFTIPETRNAAVLFARIATVGDTLPPSVELKVNDHKTRGERFTALERATPERFVWYALRVPAGAHRIQLRFEVNSNGVAVSQIRIGAKKALFHPIQMSAKTAFGPAHAEVTAATPTRLTASISTSGKGTCSATLLTTYDPLWSGRLLGESHALPHFIADGWANGFIIPCGGSRRIIFTFASRFFNNSAISGRILLVLLVIVVVVFAPRRMRMSVETDD